MIGLEQLIDAENFRQEHYYKALYDSFEERFGTYIIKDMPDPRDRVTAIEELMQKTEEARAACPHLPGMQMVFEKRRLNHLKPIYHASKQEIPYYEEQQQVEQYYFEQIANDLEEELAYERERQEELLKRKEQIKEWLDSG